MHAINLLSSLCLDDLNAGSCYSQSGGLPSILAESALAASWRESSAELTAMHAGKKSGHICESYDLDSTR